MNSNLESITINWKILGCKLANLTDQEQSDFFTGFIKEIDSYETSMQKEIQLLSIQNKLTKEIKQKLKQYMPCLWFSEESE